MLEKLTGLLLALSIHAAIILLLLQTSTISLFSPVSSTNYTSLTAETVDESLLQRAHFMTLPESTNPTITTSSAISGELEILQHEKENNEGKTQEAKNQLVPVQTQEQKIESAIAPEPEKATTLAELKPSKQIEQKAVTLEAEKTSGGGS